MKSSACNSALTKLLWVTAFAFDAGVVPSPLFAQAPKFQETFAVEKADLSATGRNDYFILEPGFVAVFEGEEKGENLLKDGGLHLVKYGAGAK